MGTKEESKTEAETKKSSEAETMDTRWETET